MKNKGLSKEDYFKKPLYEYTKWFYMCASSVNLDNFSNLYQKLRSEFTKCWIFQITKAKTQAS